MAVLITKGIDDKTDGVDLKNRTISGWISRIETDRDGEVVKPTAFEKHLDVYLKNGVLLLFHQHRSLPIGKVLEAKIYPNEGVWAKFYITKNPIGNEILQLVDERILNGFSAGFVPIIAEENPPISKIPHEALKTSMGKKIKKLYSEVEWVETSLLPIPSNRLALIDRAEKGNSVANIIVKSFDREDDFEIVLKEWVESKSFWDETDHPRDDSGRFTESRHVSNVLDPIRESNYYPSGGTAMSTNRAVNETNRNVVESNKRLDEISKKQDQMNAGVNRISNHTSWGNWFTKYGIVAASAIGAYLFFKHGKKVSVKGLDEGDSRIISLLNIIKNFIDKGEELGLTNTTEYNKIKKFYNNAISAIREVKENKGLSSFWVANKGLGFLITKEMTSETFDESEHPRHADGKFRKKSEGSGVKKTKPEEVSHETYHDPTEKIKHNKVLAQFGKENGEKFINWAKENKGKILLAAASVPIVFTTFRLGSRSLSITKSKNATSISSWDDMLRSGKHTDFYDSMEPGDIILSGVMPPGSFSEVKDDIKKVVNKKLFKSGKGTEAATSGDRLMEHASKVATGGQYTHAFICVGKLNDDFLKKIRDFGASSPENYKKANNVLMNLALDINNARKLTKETQKKFKPLKYINEEGKLVQLPDDLKKIKDNFDFSKIDFTPYFGVPLRAQGGRGVASLGVFLAPHSGRPSRQITTVAIARTKLDKDTVNKVVDGTLNDIFNQTQTGIVHPWSMKTLIRPTSRGGLFDPVTGKLIGAFFRNDQVVCSGVIAKFYERHGKKIFKDASVVSPMDFIKNEKLIDRIIIPRKTKDKVNIESVDSKKFNKDDKFISEGKVLAGVATATGSTVLYENKDKFKSENKGLSFLVIKEAEFDESEHPRDSSGRFTEKLNKDSGPSPEKGSWGGYRAYSGRLPKDPIQAKEKLTQKFKTENPNITDDELKSKILDHAVQNGKPDLAFAVTNPIEYQKQREAELQDIANDRYNRISINGKRMSIDSPNDIYDAKNEIKSQATKWKQETTKAKSVTDAWRTFSREDAEAQDKSRAKLILGAALIATSLGIGVKLLKRKSLTSAGFKINPDLSESSIRKLHKNVVNLHEVPNDTYFRILKLKEPPEFRAGHLSDAEKWTAAYRNELSSFERLLNFTLSPFLKKDQVIVLGAKLTGLKSGRWRFPLFNRFQTGKGQGNYRPNINDVDTKYGLQLFRKIAKGEDLEINPLNLTIARGWVPRIPPEGKKVPKRFAKALDIDKQNGTWIVKDEDELVKAIYEKGAKKGKEDKGGPLASMVSRTEKDGKVSYKFKQDALPGEVDRRTTGDQQKAWDTMADQYEEWSKRSTKLNQTISRKTLAYLATSTGLTGTAASGMYFFNKEINDAFDESNSDISNPISKVLSMLDKSKDNTKELDKQIKLEGLKEKRIKAELFKEAVRQNVISDLINQLSIRNPEEGAIQNKSFTESVIRARFNKVFREMGYPSTANGISKLREDMNDPEIREQILKRFEEDIKANFGNNKSKMKDQYNKDNPNNKEYDDAQSETGTEDDSDKTTKEINIDLILKSISEDDSPNITEDEALSLVSFQIASMISDISQSCKEVIESGMPGHSKFEELNRVIEDFYVYMKDHAKNPEEDEISEKSFDNSDAMASNIDSSGGLLAGDTKKPKNQKCEVCGKIATEEVVKNCMNDKCPNNFLDTIEVKE